MRLVNSIAICSILSGNLSSSKSDGSAVSGRSSSGGAPGGGSVGGCRKVNISLDADDGDIGKVQDNIDRNKVVIHRIR